MRFNFQLFMGVPCCERLSSSELRNLLLSSRRLTRAQSTTQADLLLVVGHITHKQAPLLQTVWAEFAQPSWCIHFAGCTRALQNYSIVEELSDVVSVDLSVDNCQIDSAVIERSLKSLTSLKTT